MNYRLGVLGYTFLERLNTAFAGSGNAGLLDIVLAALVARKHRQVRRRSEQRNLIRPSGGGQKICMLMAMRAAKGLFHRAIVQSGQAPRALEPAYVDHLARALLAELAVEPGSVRQLQQVPLQKLLTAYHEVYARHCAGGTMEILQGFVPVVDGSARPDIRSATVLHAKRQDTLIIGCTRTEMSQLALASDPSLVGMNEDALSPRCGRCSALLLRPWFAAIDGLIHRSSPWELYLVLTADWPTRSGSIEIGDKQARQAPVYMYRIDWETEADGGRLHSPHTVEISLVFRTLQSEAALTGARPRVEKLSELISSSWISFARLGTPEAEGLPLWPQYEPARRATMIFWQMIRTAPTASA